VNSEQTLISVIMPSYNHGSFIGDAVASVLSQTHRNLELIVVDNFSTDSTADVLSRFDDPRLQVHRFDNRGVIAAGRNHGLAHARGEWVAFLDSDDSWLPHKLERQAAHVTVPGVSCIASDFVPIGDIAFCKKHIHFAPGQQFRDYSFEEVAMANPVMTSSAMVQRSVLQDAGGFDESRDLCFIEDWDLWLRMAKTGAIRVLNEELIRYRIVMKKGRDTRDVALRTLHIIRKQAASGDLHDEALRRTLGNCYLRIGKAHLDVNDPAGIRYFARSLLWAPGIALKVKSLVGLTLLCLPQKCRRLFFERYYR
jgi:teichuronic acid biosynthesis glycosyltransferase TuaG